MSVKAPPTAADLLATPGSFLTRSHLRELGFTRTMADAVFLELDVIFLPGSKRGVVRRDDFVKLVERSTFRDDGARAA